MAAYNGPFIYNMTIDVLCDPSDPANSDCKTFKQDMETPLTYGFCDSEDTEDHEALTPEFNISRVLGSFADLPPNNDTVLCYKMRNWNGGWDEGYHVES